MKLFRFYTIVFILCLLPLAVLANKWNKPDKELFSCQKDLEKTVSAYSKNMASIYFHGKLFNFINYDDTKIIVRKITKSADEISWSCSKQDDIDALRLSSYNWTPSTFVFHDTLYLYMSNMFRSTAYSVYDEANDQWSDLEYLDDTRIVAEVVVDDKIVYIRQANWGGLEITVEKSAIFRYDIGENYLWFDLINGLEFSNSAPENFTLSLSNLDPVTHYGYYPISAISKSYVDENGEVKTKIMIAYLTDDLKAKVAELAFDDHDFLQLLSNETVASEFEYSSVSIVDGTVEGDPTTNNTTQLFLKKATKDNGYCRYRLLRYQKEEGGDWSKRENNLVKQNYLWASKNMDINAVNFPYADNKQLMCLIYRGYDDWDHPLNIAWAENNQVNLANPQSVLAATALTPVSNNVINESMAVANTESNTLSLEQNIPLLQNWPNPFSSVTTIKYQVGTETQENSYELQQYTKLVIYDYRGNLVRILVNEIKPPGYYEVEWEASSLPNGLYFCCLQNGNQSNMCKLVLIK